MEGGGPPDRLRDAAATDRRLLSRSSLTVGSRLFAKGASLIFLVAVARLLSIEQFAAYSYVVVVATVFTIVSDTGAALVSSRDIAAGRGAPGDRFWAAAPIVAAGALLAGLALLGFGAVDSGPGSDTATMLLAAAFVVFNRGFDLMTTTLHGLGRFGMESALQAGTAALYIATGVAAAAAGVGTVALIGLLAAKEALGFAIGWLAVRSEVGSRRGRAVDWRGLLRAGISLSLAGIALAVVMRLPLTVLGNSASDAEVAVFSAAQRFGDAAVLVTTTAGFALLPGLSFLGTSEPERVRSLLRRVLAAAVAASVAVAAVAIPFGGTLMAVAFGDAFRSGDTSLQIVLAGLPAYTVLGICWYSLVSLDRERAALWVALGGLVVSVTCGFVLIPSEGAPGAGVTYVAGLAAIAVGSLGVLTRRLASRAAPLTRGELVPPA